jgi:hypothetical protein
MMNRSLQVSVDRPSRRAPGSRQKTDAGRPETVIHLEGPVLNSALQHA